MNAAEYRAPARLRDGRPFEIRALLPDDRQGWLDFHARTSAEARYNRFHSVKDRFSEDEIRFHTEVDFVAHVALVAAFWQAEIQIGIGGARYIVTGPGEAVVAFQVDEAFRGQGVAGQLMDHLVLVGRAAGLHTFVADVLSHNTPMLKVLRSSGLPQRTKREGGLTVVHMDLSDPPAPAPTSADPSG